MRVLVTGGAGFIGSHVVQQLLARGDSVCVIDDLRRGKRRHVPAPARLVVAELQSEAARACVASFAPQAIVHLAAQMDVGASVLDPVHDAEVNVLGTLAVLQAAAEAKAATFVAASSGGALYGDAQALPTDERAPCQPVSPYGASKACSEIYLDLWARSTSMRCVSLRLSNVYGPRQSHRGEAGVVAIFADRMLRGVAPILHGDGLQSRDFIYAADVARAFVLAVNAPEVNGAYNVGTGAETTLLQLAAALAQATKFDGPLQFAPAKAGEVRRSCLHARALKEACGWQPRWELQAGLEATVAALRRSRGAAASATQGDGAVKRRAGSGRRPAANRPC